MEVDFSLKIQELFKNSRSQNPIEVSKASVEEKIVSCLESKAKEHNEKFNNVSIEQLKKVFRRGSESFDHCVLLNQTRNSWGMARANMFLKMMRGEQVKESYKDHDSDISSNSENYYHQEPSKIFWQFDQIDFDLARLDLIKANVDLETEGNIDLFDIDYSDAEKKTLNKPFRLPSGSNKKFGVYVKNDKGNVVVVKFGDPNMEIKRDNPERRKSFRARHNCENPGPKWKPRYWSCKFWSKKPVSSMAAEDLLFNDDEIGEWDYDDSSFVERENLFAINENLKNITFEVEEDGI